MDQTIRYCMHSMAPMHGILTAHLSRLQINSCMAFLVQPDQEERSSESRLMVPSSASSILLLLSMVSLQTVRYFRQVIMFSMVRPGPAEQLVGEQFIV